MERKWMHIGLSAFAISFALQTDAYAQTQEDVIQNILEKEKEVDNNKQLLDQLLLEISEKENALSELKEHLQTIEKEIQTTDQKIAEIEQKVQASRTQIEEQESQLEEKKELLGRNLKIMHEKGEISFVEFLFRSESLSNFLYRYQLLKDVGEQHKIVIDDVRDMMVNLETQKREEQNIKKEQQLEILKQYQSKQEVTNLKIEQENLVSSINQKYKEVENQVSQDEEVIKQMIYEIQELSQTRTSEIPEGSDNQDIIMPGNDVVDIAYKWVLYRGLGSEKPVIYSMERRQLTLATYGDCSAFTRRVYMDAGYGHIGYTTADQIANPNGAFIEKVEDLQPGDLMYFGPTGSHVVYSYLPNGKKVATAHTAIYVGNGKMIDLAAGIGTISIKDFSEGERWEWYVKNRWVGGKRFEKQ